MWETCHQMSWVWLKGSEAGLLHPTTSRRERNVIKKTAVGTTPSAKTVVFSSYELLNRKGCMIYILRSNVIPSCHSSLEPR